MNGVPARVVVLGGGVGGTLVANLLDKRLGKEAAITVVDPTGHARLPAGVLYLALGGANAHWLSRDERTLLRGGVDLAIEEAVRIHPEAGTVQLARGGSIAWDYLVIATGARLVYDARPGREGLARLLLATEAERRRPPSGRSPEGRS